MQEETKKRKQRTSAPSELERANRMIGRIMYFFNGVSHRLKNPDNDIFRLMTKQERDRLLAAHYTIGEVQRDVLERQVQLVAKLKEERDAAKLSNNN